MFSTHTLSMAQIANEVDSPSPPAHNISQISNNLPHPILPILNLLRRPHHPTPGTTLLIKISRKSPSKRFISYFPSLWGSLWSRFGSERGVWVCRDIVKKGERGGCCCFGSWWGWRRVCGDRAVYGAGRGSVAVTWRRGEAGVSCEHVERIELLQ